MTDCNVDVLLEGAKLPLIERTWNGAMDATYAGIVVGTHAVVAELVPPADIWGGGHGRDWVLPMSGTAAPRIPAEVTRKSLRLDMFTSP